MTKGSRKEILGMSTVTYKYQITIPKKVREQQDFKEGDTILFVIEGDRIYLTRSTEL